MKVLIVFNHPAPYKVRMFNELSNYVDLTVIFERNKAKDRNTKFYENTNSYKFNSIILKDKYWGNEGSYSGKVKEYIKNHYKEYDFIIMNGYSHIAEIKAINYMIKHDIKYGLMINGIREHAKESKIKQKIKQKMISNASYFLSPTKLSSTILERYGANPIMIFSYPYSNISSKDIVNKIIDKDIIRKKYNLPLNKTLFISSSQFIERKNNLKLLEIFKNRDEHLVLVGEGKLLHQYQKFINENNMQNIHIINYLNREDLFDLYQSADTFITLSKDDIFGQTTIEALANGLSVVSSDKVNSSLEYIKNGFNGYIVDLNNDDDINNAIKKSKDLSRNNAINSIKEINFENCALRIFDILKGVKL